jgi:hypothetical protein
MCRNRNMTMRRSASASVRALPYWQQCRDSKLVYPGLSASAQTLQRKVTRQKKAHQLFWPRLPSGSVSTAGRGFGLE